MRGCPPLSHDEREQIFAYLTSQGDERMLCMISIGLCTGFRISELCGLKVKDVYANGSVLKAAHARKVTTKGKRSGRVNYLSSKCKSLIDSYIRNVLKIRADYNSELPLFPSTKGIISYGIAQHLTSRHAWRLMQTAFFSAKLEFNGTHTLRKTIANDIYVETKDILEVKSRLGHISLNSTASYLESISSDKGDKVVDKVF